jgi:hypothetical protein
MGNQEAEWFQEHGEEIICLLEQTKGNRPQQRTTHYRPDAIANWRRMNLRRPKGLLVFPAHQTVGIGCLRDSEEKPE